MGAQDVTPMEGVEGAFESADGSVYDADGVLLLGPPDPIEFRPHEREEHVGVVKEVTRYEGSEPDGDGGHPGGYSINFDIPGVFGNGCGLSDTRNPDGFEPKPGDGFILRTEGFSNIRGMAFTRVEAEGQTATYDIFDLTDADLDAERVEFIHDLRRRRLREFLKRRAQMDADYEALPDVMKRRIDKYRENNPDFRVEYEAYEMASVIDAVKIADALRPALEEKMGWSDAQAVAFLAGEDPDRDLAHLQEAAEDPEERERRLRRMLSWKLVKDFAEMEYDEQRAMVDISDQHSGNTFGMACRLGWLYLSGDGDDVVNHYGAMAPLVGSDEYGDVPQDAEVV